ncbi:hypothetical protein GYMLUDRAFT_689682 [Collybiopsis luxurians FD-317 M1]|uniref:Uncharacterized protein n=1 Tax=Collybiopsis luxurians FD-317 M1 TaxID=944289 RepID=A0A0D0CJZ5_9AGAR|nr:hypothetical protein GYMLUDRAFT_689682 [Collybiopsis luxurians FD-317 M1]
MNTRRRLPLCRATPGWGPIDSKNSSLSLKLTLNTLAAHSLYYVWPINFGLVSLAYSSSSLHIIHIAFNLVPIFNRSDSADVPYSSYPVQPRFIFQRNDQPKQIPSFEATSCLERHYVHCSHRYIHYLHQHKRRASEPLDLVG